MNWRSSTSFTMVMHSLRTLEAIWACFLASASLVFSIHLWNRAPDARIWYRSGSQMAVRGTPELTRNQWSYCRKRKGIGNQSTLMARPMSTIPFDFSKCMAKLVWMCEYRGVHQRLKPCTLVESYLSAEVTHEGPVQGLLDCVSFSMLRDLQAIYAVWNDTLTHYSYKLRL